MFDAHTLIKVLYGGGGGMEGGGGGCHALHDATSFPAGSSLVSLSVGTLRNYSTVSCTHSEKYKY
jgi:hypothetical protein